MGESGRVGALVCQWERLLVNLLGVEVGQGNLNLAKARIPVWIFVVRLLRDRLFVGPGVSAATGRALSS